MNSNNKEEYQINFLNQGFEREKCLFINSFPCTHYWSIRTMNECDGIDCNKKCCKDCNDICGYMCNAESYMRENKKR